jgi:uncharacterized membrane protein YhiD involved in acid resistance
MSLDFDFLRLSPLAAVLLAAGLGAGLGWVGPFRRKAIGLAAHSALAAAASLYARHAGSTYALALPVVEPNHVMGIVIAGVCLLGATTAFRFRNGFAQGLASSASLLFTALIGLLAGSGELALALGAAVVALVALAAPEPVAGPVPPTRLQPVPRPHRAPGGMARVSVTVPNSSLRLP